MNKTDLVKVIKDTVSETLDGVTVKDTAIFGEKGWGFYFRRAMI